MIELADIPTAFTPVASMAGGVLIGLAAVMLMVLIGRIFGATGILSGLIAGLLQPASGPIGWRAMLLLGMVSGPVVVLLVTGSMPEIQPVSSAPMMALGGLLVGIGVTYGSGCTSGHGVCGMARFSVRSIAATAVFMVATGITVYVLRHGIGG